MLMLSGYLVGVLAGLIGIALFVGMLTLPIFFIVLFLVQVGARIVAEKTGTFSAKLILIMFRGLLRSPLRTSLTYLALFVLTLVLFMSMVAITLLNSANGGLMAGVRPEIRGRAGGSIKPVTSAVVGGP